MTTQEKLKQAAPYRITCTFRGRPWSGSFYDLDRALDLLARLRGNPDATDIKIEEGEYSAHISPPP